MAESIDGSDTKIRLKLPFNISDILPKKNSGPEKQSVEADEEDSVNRSKTNPNAAIEEQEQGQSAAMHYDQQQSSNNSERYQEEYTSSRAASSQHPKQKQNTQQATAPVKKRNQFWNFRHKPKNEAKIKQKLLNALNQSLTNPMNVMPPLDVIATLPEEEKLKYAYQICRNANTRVHRIRAASKHLMKNLEQSRMATQNHVYVNNTNTGFKTQDYPLLFRDDRGRTLQNTTGSTMVQQGTVDAFIRRNLHGGEPSYLQEVASFGNFAFQPRKRRRHHYQ